jgi:GH43 family beta-xylosidase
MYKDGYYYYTNTLGNRLAIWKTKNMADLRSAESKTIWKPPANTMYSKNLWAPEIHFIRNKWYVYFAADDGRNENHRMYVIENSSRDPMQGEWVLKGKVADPDDKWAIDGSIFKYRGKRYMVWSGWEGDVNGSQDIYIARLKNPWTIKGKRVRIASPVFAWEQHGDINESGKRRHVNVNEGPQFLRNKRKLFLIFSASGCWTDHYALGMMRLKGRKLMDSSSWQKHEEPVFVGSPKKGVYAPGHNSFFRSPDGTENWILYHANAEPGQGCGRFRSPRAQKFGWNKDGSPNFGEPLKTGVLIPVPKE